MPLTDTKIKNTKAKEKDLLLTDRDGLYLAVKKSGSKIWRYRKLMKGKPIMLSIGPYPEISLADARATCLEYNKMVVQGIHPRAELEQDSGTFETVAREWHAKKSTTWSEGHAVRIMRGLESNIFPWLGSTPINSITPPALLKVIKRIEARGTIETAHRDLSVCGQIFRFGVASGYCERDVAADLRGALTPVVHKNHAAIIEPQAIGELLRSIEAYQGSHIVRCALRLLPYVFTRPGELRNAEWTEINFKAAEWRIPPEKMKARRLHIVPLSRQALEILQNDLRPLTGSGPYLFPGRVSARPMSENTINAALRTMGYEKGRMTGHGFRSIASSHLNEAAWHRDAIERQLAHAEGNEVRAAYLHADFLSERRTMMQWWADALDLLREGAEEFPRRDENNG
jgi:integrase